MSDREELIVRFPDSGDSRASFEAAGLLQGRVTLTSLLAHHAPERGQFTLVAEFEGAIVGVVALTVQSGSLHVDFLTRNALAKPPAGVRIGEALMFQIEEVARELDLNSLSLESVDDARTLSFYERHGFTPSGLPFFEEGWGRLLPLTKRVGERA